MSQLEHYCIQEADFMLPAQWLDQSLNVFKIPASDAAGAASFVISRDPAKGDRTLEEYVREQLERCHDQLAGFELKKHEYFKSRGVDAGWLEYGWVLEGRPLHLRQVFFDLGQRVLIYTLTTNPRDIAHHETAWRAVMCSIVLARPGERAAAAEIAREADAHGS